MAKKTSKTAENKKAKTTSTRAKKQTQAPVVDTKPTLTPKLIVAQRKFNRWYVYFKGVAPKDNVGCGCKTAQSAIRYMHLLKARYGAVISQTIYDRLAFEAAREA